MDQLPTFLTFTMIAVFIFFPMISDLFKTGTARTVYYILRDQTFFHHLLQMTVNGRGSDGNPFSLKKSQISFTVTCLPCTDFRKVSISVICFVLYGAFAILTSSLQFESRFHFITLFLYVNEIWKCFSLFKKNRSTTHRLLSALRCSCLFLYLTFFNFSGYFLFEWLLCTVDDLILKRFA